MPDSAEKVLDALGEPGRELSAFGERERAAVSKIDPLFPRVE
jgi:hypothetical protein